MSRDRPAISVVLPTTDGWDHVAECVDELAAQVARCAGEVVVAIGAGDAPQDVPDRVRVVEQPGASVFELRARGVEAARGSVIAITEDHCVVAGDWCAALLEAHARFDDALGVAGAVDNGSTRSRSDWANFLVTFGAYAPPLAAQSDRAMPIANASYKRAALDGAPSPLPTGWLEFDLGPRLLADGLIAFDERAVVQHVQSPGAWGAIRAHFHNGRSTTGLLRGTLASRARWREAARRLRLPAILLRQTRTHVADKPRYRRELQRSLPMVVALCVAHAAGEAVGVLGGPGRSPLALE